MTYLYLDIETIPAQTDDAKARIAATVKPPAQMKKAETIAEWERTQKASAVEDAIAKSSFDAAFGQICCIGFAIDAGQSSSQMVTHPDSERTVIQCFFDHVSAMIPQGTVTVVGHYVAGFDIRFIWQRCMVLGIRVPSWMPKDPKPWGPDVFDTMTAWAGQKGTISLDNLCAALGIEGKGDVDGSMIGKMFAEGRHNEIAAYCRDDVDRVRAVHRKMMIAFGEN